MHCVFSNYMTENTNIRQMHIYSKIKTYKNYNKTSCGFGVLTKENNLLYQIFMSATVSLLCHGLSNGALHFSFKSVVSVVEEKLIFSRANKNLL